VANTRPYTEAHAVAWVDVALFLGGKLPSKERDFLRIDFEKALAEEGFVAEKPRAKSSAFVFKRSGVAGEVVDELHIHEAFVHLLSNEYRSWTFARDTAFRRLAPLFRWLDHGRVEVSGVGMAYRDIFICDTPDDYDVADVFRLQNRYLPAVLLQAGERWKQHISMPGRATHAEPLAIRDSIDIEAKISNAEGDATNESDLHVTEITHRLTTRWDQGADVAVKWSESRFYELLNCLHARNKAVLLELLCDEMIDKIGLKE
jgi:hypothetical protein